MVRKLGLIVLAALLLGGCGDRIGRSGLSRAPMMLALHGSADGKPQIFSYTHRLDLILPQGGVKRSFETGRDACLNRASLHCDLLTASLSSGESGDEASIIVAVPHDQVAVFEKILTGTGASVQSRSANAENVATEAGDNDRKVVQLKAWRDRLAALSKRSDISVADLMKVEAELSKAEADLGAAEAEKHDIDGRIAKEVVSVSFNERESVLAPIGRVFANAGATLIDSVANAIEFLIRVIPWLPIVLAGLWLIRWLWWRRKKAS